MKKIIMSLSIIAAVAAVVVGGTTAFFNDEEKSTDNTFAAGAIDLKVSNDSYVSNRTTGALERSNNTTWESTDLNLEKFFDFTDLKPGDIGEDTIDLTVKDNDAWACAELKLTSNKDNGCSEPETAANADPNCNPNSTDIWDGELAQGIEFVWWADDGDNVLEVDEEATKYYLGPESIKNLLGEDNVLQLTIADSVLNFFKQEHPNGGPLAGGKTYYIGKGWCFGDMKLDPAEEGDGGPLDRKATGFICSGLNVGNAAQTDSLTADLAFTAFQSRNNMKFLCPEHVRAE